MNFSFLKDEYTNAGGNLIIMCGPPACGKTTIALNLKEEIPNSIIISPDNIREELTGDMTNQSFNVEVFNTVYARIKDALKNGYNVIYDATNCRNTHRYKIIDTCREYTYRIICLMSVVPLETCFENNRKRNRVVPSEVIERMYFTLKKHPPTIFEGFDLIVRF